jgi:hypothetical protein
VLQEAELSLSNEGVLRVYTINYQGLSRTVKIYFSSAFPYTIEKWEDTYPVNGKSLTTAATRKKTLTNDYWNHNKNKDAYLRDSLGLRF